MPCYADFFKKNTVTDLKPGSFWEVKCKKMFMFYHLGTLNKTNYINWRDHQEHILNSKFDQGMDEKALFNGCIYRLPYFLTLANGFSRYLLLIHEKPVRISLLYRCHACIWRGSTGWPFNQHLWNIRREAGDHLLQ